MRKRKSFLLTIIAAEEESPLLCGRLKTIATGQTSSFCSADELKNLILSELDSKKEDLAGQNLSLICSDFPARSS